MCASVGGTLNARRHECVCGRERERERERERDGDRAREMRNMESYKI